MSSNKTDLIPGWLLKSGDYEKAAGLSLFSKRKEGDTPNSVEVESKIEELEEKGAETETETKEEEEENEDDEKKESNNNNTDRNTEPDTGDGNKAKRRRINRGSEYDEDDATITSAPARVHKDSGGISNGKGDKKGETAKSKSKKKSSKKNMTTMQITRDNISHKTFKKGATVNIAVKGDEAKSGKSKSGYSYIKVEVIQEGTDFGKGPGSDHTVDSLYIVKLTEPDSKRPFNKGYGLLRSASVVDFTKKFAQSGVNSTKITLTEVCDEFTQTMALFLLPDIPAITRSHSNYWKTYLDSSLEGNRDNAWELRNIILMYENSREMKLYMEKDNEEKRKSKEKPLSVEKRKKMRKKPVDYTQGLLCPPEVYHEILLAISEEGDDHDSIRGNTGTFFIIDKGISTYMSVRPKTLDPDTMVDKWTKAFAKLAKLNPVEAYKNMTEEEKEEIERAFQSISMGTIIASIKTHEANRATAIKFNNLYRDFKIQTSNSTTNSLSHETNGTTHSSPITPPAPLPSQSTSFKNFDSSNAVSSINPVPFDPFAPPEY